MFFRKTNMSLTYEVNKYRVGVFLKLLLYTRNDDERNGRWPVDHKRCHSSYARVIQIKHGHYF
jgi:hypothetical protein